MVMMAEAHHHEVVHHLFCGRPFEAPNFFHDQLLVIKEGAWGVIEYSRLQWRA